MKKSEENKIIRRQRMLENGFRFFADRGIELVTIDEIAQACGLSRITVYRYFTDKLELVIEIGVWKWREYMQRYDASFSEEALNSMTAAGCLKAYLDAFIDLYRNHRDILRFNHYFNSYVLSQGAGPDRMKRYIEVVDALRARFHQIYLRGREDGTLNTDIPEEEMLSSSVHIMLAVATRYAIGLVYVPEPGDAPEQELLMLEELLLSRFTRS